MAKSLMFLLAATVLCSGCSTVAVPPQQASPVPADRLVRAAQAGDSTVTVVRDSGILGAACYLALYVNRELVARMGRSEMVSLSVPAGEVLLGVGGDPSGNGLCATDITRVQRETLLKPGEHKVFRMVIQFNGGIDLMRSDF